MDARRAAAGLVSGFGTFTGIFFLLDLVGIPDLATIWAALFGGMFMSRMVEYRMQRRS
jgi:hypothetical protein